MKGKHNAFTLLELLLVLALIGVMLSLAVSSWQQYQLRVIRGQTFQQLQRIGLAQEVFKLQNGEYAASIDTFDLDHTTQSYTYTMTLGEQGYLLVAKVKPEGPQSNDTSCWTLTLSDTGLMQSLSKEGENRACK